MYKNDNLTLALMFFIAFAMVAILFNNYTYLILGVLAFIFIYTRS